MIIPVVLDNDFVGIIVPPYFKESLLHKREKNK
jgi:hypothetical protein